ncbi:hypothetical protein GGQ63_001702 [Prosthecomicrobium pneumaticum]|uniref:Uncharacterized protein n=1 Tax=Prosthecomicrobium pneumaticum TaxID=81895 RepID=A0A7W9CVH4_9HYPH|nr:hypothetical protein [Prosthecomicrobium pneumaticum]
MMTDGEPPSSARAAAGDAAEESARGSAGRRLRALAALLLAPLFALLLVADPAAPLRYDPASGRVEWNGADHRPSLALLERVDPARKPAEPRGEGGASATPPAAPRLPLFPATQRPWRPAAAGTRLERSGASAFEARAPPAR